MATLHLPPRLESPAALVERRPRGARPSIASAQWGTIDTMLDQTEPRPRPGFDLMGHLRQFTPKLVITLREGYSGALFAQDAMAGLTVAILALPLSMAIAIGAGVTPDAGLITSVVAGFLISAFGGSRFQIGGPAAAFIVIIAAVLTKHGEAA